MKVTVLWEPEVNAPQALQKRVAAENLPTAPGLQEELLEVVQPNGSKKAWDRSGREHPVPPRP